MQFGHKQQAQIRWLIQNRQKKNDESGAWAELEQKEPNSNHNKSGASSTAVAQRNDQNKNINKPCMAYVCTNYNDSYDIVGTIFGNQANMHYIFNMRACGVREREREKQKQMTDDEIACNAHSYISEF